MAPPDLRRDHDVSKCRLTSSRPPCSCRTGSPPTSVAGSSSTTTPHHRGLLLVRVHPVDRRRRRRQVPQRRGVPGRRGRHRHRRHGLNLRDGVHVASVGALGWRSSTDSQDTGGAARSSLRCSPHGRTASAFPCASMVQCLMCISNRGVWPGVGTGVHAGAPGIRAGADPAYRGRGSPPVCDASRPCRARAPGRAG